MSTTTASSQPPPPLPEETTSTCTPQTARGRHVFQIEGYTLHRGFGVGKFIQSAAFTVGGYSWCIRCYPDGASEDSKAHVSVFLRLVTRNAKVRALYKIGLIGQTTMGSSSPAPCTSGREVFDTMNSGEAVCGSDLFVKASELEASAEYLRDDCLVIECDVTVIKEPLVTEDATNKPVEIEVPPSDLPDDFGKLLETREGADIIFNVQGEYFFAHRIVLAARSPVFGAELCGIAAGEHNRGCITIDGMEPAAFGALLHFIYTDSLPGMDDLDVDEIHGMVKHLFVAADRYAMERLKSVCMGILCRCLGDSTVESTLVLADQYNCSELKDVCLKYVDSSRRVGDVLASQQASRRLRRAKPSIWMVLWKKARSLFKFK
jgi:speckle-type POZ protein